MLSYSHGNRDSQTLKNTQFPRDLVDYVLNIVVQTQLPINHDSKIFGRIRFRQRRSITRSITALSFGVSHEFSTYSVLLKFRKSLFSCIHEETWSIQYQYRLAFSSMAVLAAKNSTESSSAYKQIQEGISFMYYLKSRGPKGDP